MQMPAPFTPDGVHVIRLFFHFVYITGLDDNTGWYIRGKTREQVTEQVHSVLKNNKKKRSYITRFLIVSITARNVVCIFSQKKNFTLQYRNKVNEQ